MANIIPNKPRGTPGRAFMAFYRTLKGLPDTFTAWLALEFRSSGLPQVFLVWRERHAFLIQVAETTQELAESALQGDLFQDGKWLRPEDLGREECGLLDDFLVRSARLLGPLAGELPLRRLVVFPNVLEGTVDEVVMLRSSGTETSYLGMHQVPSVHFARRLEAMAEAALPEPGLAHLRRVFTPESVVPTSFVPRLPADRNTVAPAPTSGFLDFDQEWCVKNDLELLPEHQSVLDRGAGSVRLVTGVAGSGKSLVLLYRALLSARLHPDASVLVLTHNKPLRFELERRSRHLGKLPPNLRCLTFFQWAAECLGPWHEEMWWPADVERALAGIRTGFPSLVGFSTAFLLDEIGWIKDQRLTRRADYLTADRSGRGAALRAEHRQDLWQLFRIYQEYLAKSGATDWHNIALRFHEAAVTAKRLDFPHHDAVLVDEAQFFARSWFEIVGAALKPGGHLFLAADPTQGFLRRRQSWIAAGIDVRGRSTRLKRPYRTTRAILRFARDFHVSRSASDDTGEDLNIPDDAQISSIVEEGLEPSIIHVPTPQDEIARAVNEVAAMRDAGVARGNLLILHANSRMEKSLRSALSKRLGARAVHDPRTGPITRSSFCSVTSLAAATGLEAPVVMLLGIDWLLDKERDPRLSAEELDDLRRDHTRMIYMGFTRAGQRLLMFRRTGGEDLA